MNPRYRELGMFPMFTDMSQMVVHWQKHVKSRYRKLGCFQCSLICSHMFGEAETFNQDIGIGMFPMLLIWVLCFREPEAFNQEYRNWDVSNVH